MKTILIAAAAVVVATTVAIFEPADDQVRIRVLPMGQTITAASCSVVDVQAAITTAVNGDTVAVPGTACTWTTGITIDEAIILRPVTTLTITHNKASGELIGVTESTAGYIEIKDFNFAEGTGPDHTIRTYPTTNGRPILIHDNAWTGEISAVRAGTHRGVIWDNTATATAGTNESFVQCQHEGLGLGDWEAASTLGTLDTTGEKNLYVETNVITGYKNQATDSDANCRMVFRYNTMAYSAMTSHGPDTGPYGNRHTEVYNNVFTYDDGSVTCLPPTAQDYLMYLRGGMWVIYNNTMPDVNSVCLGDKAEFKVSINNLRQDTGQPLACYNDGAGGPGPYPMPRQHGQGHNGSIYITEKMWIWNNGAETEGPRLENYDAFYPTDCAATNGNPDITTYVQSGRDYEYENGAMPGYTAYTYPHPATVGR